MSFASHPGDRNVPAGSVKEKRVIVRVDDAVHRKVREISSIYHVNVSGAINRFLQSWIAGFDADPELAFMTEWRAGNVMKGRVLAEMDGDVDEKARAWVARKKSG